MTSSDAETDSKPIIIIIIIIGTRTKMASHDDLIVSNFNECPIHAQMKVNACNALIMIAIHLIQK